MALRWKTAAVDDQVVPVTVDASSEAGTAAAAISSSLAGLAEDGRPGVASPE